MTIQIQLWQSRVLFGLCLGVIALWLSLFLSYRRIYFETVDNNPWATYGDGGFPLTAFEYPSMGSDIPPAKSWPPFAANLFFWLAVAIPAMFLIPARFFTKIFQSILILGTAITTLIGFVYLLLKFD